MRGKSLRYGCTRCNHDGRFQSGETYAKVYPIQKRGVESTVTTRQKRKIRLGFFSVQTLFSYKTTSSPDAPLEYSQLSNTSHLPRSSRPAYFEHPGKIDGTRSMIDMKSMLLLS